MSSSSSDDEPLAVVAKKATLKKPAGKSNVDESKKLSTKKSKPKSIARPIKSDHGSSSSDDEAPLSRIIPTKYETAKPLINVKSKKPSKSRSTPAKRTKPDKKSKSKKKVLEYVKSKSIATNDSANGVKSSNESSNSGSVPAATTSISAGKKGIDTINRETKPSDATNDNDNNHDHLFESSDSGSELDLQLTAPSTEDDNVNQSVAKLDSPSTSRDGLEKSLSDQTKANENSDKKPGNESDTSDTSIEDNDVTNEDQKEKLSEKKEKSESEENSSQKQLPNEAEPATAVDIKPKPAAEPDPMAKKLSKLRRVIRASGLFRNYKLIYNEEDSDKKKVDRIQEYFRSRGFEPPYTITTAKEFKAKIDQERELAELNTNQIIGGRSERTTRSKIPCERPKLFADLHAAPSASARRARKRARTSNSSGSDADKDQESATGTDDTDTDSLIREQRREHEQLVQRLRGIVDSEGESD